MRPILVDAHEDLAWNMVAYGRDYRYAAVESRQKEQESGNLVPDGDTLLGWPDYQKGRVALVFGTLFAPPLAEERKQWEQFAYQTPDEAHNLYMQQLECYHQLTGENPDMFRLVTDRRTLAEVLADWQDESREAHPVGIVPLMEGAEGIRTPDELDFWWARGLRIIGLAWMATRYSGGTRSPGPLTTAGRNLLKAMAAYPFVLDISHMDPLAARQALDVYEGPVIASHANPLGMLPGSNSNRHLPDDVIRSLIERDAVIGTVIFNLFLHPEWRRGDRRDGITLETVANHMDYICQMAGSARHVGIGSDFDGGYGVQSVPADVDTIADLQKLADVLARRGYSEQDIAQILGENWLRVLQSALPEEA